MKNIFLTITVFLAAFMIFNNPAFSQNAKKIVKVGDDLAEQKKYSDAIEQYSQAILLDSTLADAYFGRANAYYKTEKYQKAIPDYKKSIQLDEKNEDYYYGLAVIYYKLDDYKNTILYGKKIIEYDKKHEKGLRLLTYSHAKINDYENALKYAKATFDLEDSELNHYNLGVIQDSLKLYKEAEYNYKMASSLNISFDDAYIALAYVLMKQNKLDEALEVANETVTRFPENTDGLLARSKIYKARIDFPNAINDLSKILMLDQKNSEIYFLRGMYYKEFTKYRDAINDFTKTLHYTDSLDYVHYQRAMAYEQVMDSAKAVTDYKMLLNISESEKILTYAKERLYNLQREAVKPEIEILYPTPLNRRTVSVPSNAIWVALEGKIIDNSDIEFVKVEDKEINFFKNEQGITVFKDSIDIEGFTEFTMTASDIYHNEKTAIFTIARTEADPPLVSLITPYASYDGEVFLSSTDPKLYIEGIVKDESLIKSIFIDENTASFVTSELNPSFTATIDIANKTSITITASDIYDNQTVKEFRFNRSGAELAEDNPMGKTWVVFLENSNYEAFASLEGPVKDVSSMRGALANYQIHNILHKKDMTKTEMERFFSIELRDLVRDNHVNSLMIWYAGHGKFINDVGYWIPTDAKRDDEFTYYSITALRASMETYTKYLTHTLVITDACESGPSFYQAMRSETKNRDCGDWTATKFKSSQVFSSAGYELAVDNSQFTKTFARSLSFNSNSCIPIETIVTKVTEAVGQNNDQKPQFGKIAGMEDEDGTFFFIKKEE